MIALGILRMNISIENSRIENEKESLDMALK